jgi:hypothetical protein
MLTPSMDYAKKGTPFTDSQGKAEPLGRHDSRVLARPPCGLPTGHFLAPMLPGAMVLQRRSSYLGLKVQNKPDLIHPHRGHQKCQGSRDSSSESSGKSRDVTYYMCIT